MPQPELQIPKVSKLQNLPIVLVAGGAGFIGSRLCESLLNQNVFVYCLDNLTTGKKTSVSKLLSYKNFSFIEQDLNTFPVNLLEKIDYIFHIAGLEEYLSGENINLEILLVNSVGTKNLLDIAAKNKSKFLFVSSHDIYQGAISSVSLSHYAGISEEDERKYTHHEAKRYGEALITTYFQKYKIDSRIVRLSDVYGPGMNLETGSELSRLIKEAKAGESLNIYGDGLEVLHPTYIDDALYGLTKAMFAQGTTGKIYTIVNPEEETTLSMAYALQSILGGGVKINFLPQKESLKFPLRSINIARTQEELGWLPKVKLSDGLKETLLYKEKTEESTGPARDEPEAMSKKITEVENKIQQIESLQKEEEPKRPKIKISFPKLVAPRLSFPSPLLITVPLVFAALMLLLLFPIFKLVSEVGTGVTNLIKMEDDARLGNFEEVTQEAENAEENFRKANATLNNISWLSSLFLDKEDWQNYERTIYIGEKVSSAAKHLAKSTTPARKILKATLSREGIRQDVEQDAIVAKEELKQADNNLALVEGEIKDGDIKIPLCEYFKKECTKIRNSFNLIPQGRSLIKDSLTVLDIYPDLIGGVDQKRVYLLLFQNNMELRPGGGFIGSYGLITFENSRLSDFSVNDIYSIDNQLKGHVDPPDEILHFLGQPNWYLRDSNWSPDFPISAKRAEWFFEKETGQEVNGVVAIDLAVAQKLLSALGPIELKDLNTSVNASNLFEKAETISEINFFPGSTQKKDFLSSLARELMNTIFNAKEENLPKILNKIGESIKEKHIQIYINQGVLEKKIADANWGGEIKKGRQDSDYLMLVDANLGANKANYFIKRELAVNIAIGKEGEITNKVVILYENKSPADTWPGGSYKNYLRLFVPLGSKLVSVETQDRKSAVFSKRLDEKALKSLKENEFLVLESSESGKTTFGFLFEVGVKSKKEIKVTYELPKDLKLDHSQNSPVYNLLFQKQPGALNDALNLGINYPSFLEIKEARPTPQISPQVISFKTDLGTDKSFQVIFLKKSD